MALQGNPFLGKLKIPAPDLSHIPNSPFESKASPTRETHHKTMAIEDSSVDQKQVKSRSKVEHKVDQKQVKSRSKVEHKVDQKQIKSGLKVDQKQQSGQQTDTESGSKVDHEVGQKRIKSGLKVDQNHAISQVVGLQRNLLSSIFDDCLNSGSKESPFYNIGQLAVRLNCSNPSVKSAIRQLRIKGLIEKFDFKDGRGGGTRFSIPDLIYRDLVNESRSKVDHKQIKRGLKVDSKVDQNSLSSSSLINTTTTGNKEAAASEESTFKIPEELRKLGFSENHLAQLKRDSKLPLELISASIEALAYDLTFDDVRRKIRSPIGLIMKLLKAGELYLSEKGFESEADRLFRECVQRAEKQKEEKSKLMEKFFDLKFEEWIEPMATEDLLKISQPVGELKGPFHIQQLKEHFRKEVFGEIQR